MTEVLRAAQAVGTAIASATGMLEFPVSMSWPPAGGSHIVGTTVMTTGWILARSPGPVNVIILTLA
eukprot:CAMPEP_0184974096 /NCGR_PEP_ID=MMETSP1098-20130426/5659_1 /TAXON_ID=89044 /ORGANISM="Spumella elongata, Strain CCAP 955/1" /LENGTH=65 /DNA_ID=CAMNT_0027496617 /DNA_START=98 /DNA_END=291 /DNA_ORIENTATION=+